MGISVRVHHLPRSHIELPQHEVIPSRVQLVLAVLNRIHTLLVVAERSQMEFLFCVHHLNNTTLQTDCHYRRIRSQTQSSNHIIESVDLFGNLHFICIENAQRTALRVQSQLLRIAVG